METRKLALTAVIASLYLAIGFLFQSVAFGQIQIRLADALYPLIAVLGVSCLLGTFLGHLLFNIYGVGAGIALGVGDLLSPFILLIPKILIWKLGKRSNKLLIVTTLLHVTMIAVWVSYLLESLFGVPFIVSVGTVFAGEFVAEIVIGVPSAKVLSRSLPYLPLIFNKAKRKIKEKLL